MSDNKEEKAAMNNEIPETATYSIDGNSFIVEIEFNEKSSETLEVILLRLMSS